MPTDYVAFAYAAIVAIGGIIGFLKAGSVPSLVAGVGSGLLAGLGAQKVSANPRNVHLLLATSALLAVFMGVRYSRTQKFMPAGLVSLLSVAVTLRYGRQLL